jgi:DNA cross-link repair 1B protein
VFCSAPTAALLALKFPSLSRRVTALPLDETTVLRLPPPPGAPPGTRATQLCVTPTDAGHCPGAVAFLFEGACGRVFHTGDWRRDDPLPLPHAADADDDVVALSYEDAVPCVPRALPAAVLRAPVDVLYLDNTFCHPSYGHPPRRAAAAALAALLRAHAGARFVIGIDTLGKEELLELAAAVTGSRVCVTPERLAAARALGAPTAHLTTLQAQASVWTVPRQKLTRGLIARMSKHTRTVGILPTGWPDGAAGGAAGGGGGSNAHAGFDASGATTQQQLVYCVPYSLHAPFRELRALVAALRPRALRGVVAAAPCVERPTDPRRHFADLLAPPASPARLVVPMPLPALPAGGASIDVATLLAAAADADADAEAADACAHATAAASGGRKRAAASPPRVCGDSGAPGVLCFELAQFQAAAFARSRPRRIAGAGLRLAAFTPAPPPLPPKIATAAAAAAVVAASPGPMPPAPAPPPVKAEASPSPAVAAAVVMAAVWCNSWAGGATAARPVAAADTG